ncbi:hypothetical protein Athai_60630 [Actinocatenispora thailandica]|uniref:Uncharacterized protein n=1 Tax=Actinocatenispora thailandica TaxID=227318 RepID=A0A7R7DVD5_9ACTN|nr:hypothetical protein Athai_60630 [Actinocatenispora thailandica]
MAGWRAGPGHRRRSGRAGQGLPNQVVAPGKRVSGDYGFTVSRRRASSTVAVGLKPDPVVQQCVLKGRAG